MVAWRRQFLDDPGPSWRAKFVGLALAVYWDGSGRGAWPSVETLARKLNTSNSTVSRGLRELKELGIVEPQPKPGRSTTYHAARIPPIAAELDALSAGGRRASERYEGASKGGDAGVCWTPKEVSEEAIKEENEVRVFLSEGFDQEHRLQESSFEEEIPWQYLHEEPSAEALLQDKRFRTWMRGPGHVLLDIPDFEHELFDLFGVHSRDVVEEVRAFFLKAQEGEQ